MIVMLFYLLNGSKYSGIIVRGRIILMKKKHDMDTASCFSYSGFTKYNNEPNEI